MDGYVLVRNRLVCCSSNHCEIREEVNI